MPRVNFDTMPEGARLWIFAADRPLSAAKRDRLLGRVDAFLEEWKAHGVPLTAARDWRYDRFLFISVDEAVAGVSGCSIDALVNDMKALESELSVTLVDNSPVMFRDGDSIRRVQRQEFAKLAAGGTVDGHTLVFNNTLTTVGQLRAGEWEVPASHSWHREAFLGVSSEQ
jgi:nicotinamidase-related amidase